MATSQHSPTRRAVLGALPAMALIGTATAVTVHAAEPADDAEILAAWQRRADALATIYQRGSYFAAETHSPDECQIVDAAEMLIGNARAVTARGALAQAWVAWGYQETEYTREDRRFGDMIRRADIGAMEREPSLDCEREFMLALIKSLRTLAGEA